MSDGPKDKAMRDAMSRLAEHYDTVQIIATTTDDDGDDELHYFGSGSMYARVEAVRQWLLDREATANAMRDKRVNEAVNPEDED